MTTTYSWRLLRAGAFRLDGGSMFGLIPRTVWSRDVPTDDRGRISVQHNCLLLERAGPAPAPAKGSPPLPSPPSSPRLIVIECGTGDKLDAKSRDLFAMEERSVIDALHEADCRCEDVEAVVVSHLHFDHAGGLTRLCRGGESPDWTGPASTFTGARGDHGVKVTFPNATVHVQRREWEDAIANRSVMTRTYFPDHLQPIRERLSLTDSPRPFSPGVTPGRDEAPAAPVALRETEIFPGVSVFLTPGHTWGQQAVKFTDTDGQTIVFTPDVMPTVNHVGAAYSLAYDVEPYTSMVTRRWFLEEAAAAGWTLVLDHEPGDAVRRVAANGKGWFTLQA
ncbi:MAG: MBL fold metallo-hydrolase [Phycisphaeraceae bacterium]|nr:MBL fold metallo-hydrolase [Phycisphaeraceae bacterium]